MSLSATATATTTQSPSTSEEKSSLQDSSDIFTRIFRDLDLFFQECENRFKMERSTTDFQSADILQACQDVSKSLDQLRKHLDKSCDQKQGLDEDEKSKQTSNTHEQKMDSSSSPVSFSSSSSSSSSSALSSSSSSSSNTQPTGLLTALKKV